MGLRCAAGDCRRSWSSAVDGDFASSTDDPRRDYLTMTDTTEAEILRGLLERVENLERKTARATERLAMIGDLAALGTEPAK